MTKTANDVKTVVLRINMEQDDATNIVNKKKNAPFKSLLSRPKKDEIDVSSLKLYYECILMLSGRYIANYFRKTDHSISVDSNVHEVLIGDGTFQVRSKSVLEKAFVGKRGKNKIDLKVEEHVFIDEESELTLDHYGRSTKFPFKVNSKTVENYPQQVLEKNISNTKKLKITHDAAIDKLKSHLKKPMESKVADLSEEFVLYDITEVYVPIFEARLIGPKKKVGILRIDAVRKKVL